MKKQIFILFIIVMCIYPRTAVKAQIKKYGDKDYLAVKAKALQYKKLSTELIQLLDIQEQQGPAMALVSAEGKGIKVQDSKIVIIVEAGKDKASQVKNNITSLGGEIISSYRDLIKIKINLSLLKELNKDTNIKKIRSPIKPLPHTITGEQVSLTGAGTAHARGVKGERIRAAVIDGGFINLDNSISHGQLPGDVITEDFTGDGLQTESEHGTACAEVVYEMAPAAQLYLMKIGDLVDLGNAVDYCVNNGIHVITHSMGWFGTGWGDGKGYVCDIADYAYDHNILWVNSAGNSQQRHYLGMHEDDDTDGWHEFITGGDNSTNSEINSLGMITSGYALTVILTWNDPWGNSSNDYDLILYSTDGGDWEYEAESAYIQDGDDDPVEYISGYVPATREYGIRISKWSGADKKLQLFSYYQDFSNRSTNSSISSPGDAKSVLTVGAIDYLNWTTGPEEDYSSHGPTLDGRIKPDICAVDNNTNFTYGRFPGTSSSSPCTAGAAVLVWSAMGFSGNPDTVRSYLTDKAIDMGISGKDNTYGYGRLNLQNLKDMHTIAVPKEDLGVYNNLVNLSDPTKNVLRFAFLADAMYTITIYNIMGEKIHSWESYYRTYEIYDWDMTEEDRIINGNLYFAEVKSDNFEKVYKFLVVK